MIETCRYSALNTPVNLQEGRKVTKLEESVLVLYKTWWASIPAPILALTGLSKNFLSQSWDWSGRTQYCYWAQTGDYGPIRHLF